MKSASSDVDLGEAVAEYLLDVLGVGEGAVGPFGIGRVRPRGPIAHVRDRLRAVHDRVVARDRVLLRPLLGHVGADAEHPVAPAAGVRQIGGGPADEAPLARPRQQMAFVGLGCGRAAGAALDGGHLLLLLARDQMHERIERQDLVLRIAQLLRLGIAADEASARILDEHHHVGGIEHARDEVALLAEPGLAQQDAAAEDHGDQREAEAGGGDHARDQDQRGADVRGHHRLRQRHRDHQREIRHRPEIGDALDSVGGQPAVAVALAGGIGCAGAEEAGGRHAGEAGGIDHQRGVAAQQRDVVIGGRPHQPEALSQHRRIDHQRDGAGQLALAGDDRAADRKSPVLAADQPERRADGQAGVGMIAEIVEQRPRIEAGGGQGEAVARHHAQRAFLVADDEALHRQQGGQSRLHALLQARGAGGLQLVGTCQPGAGELQHRVDLAQVPRRSAR